MTSVDGEEIWVGDYVFVRCEDDREDVASWPEIGKVKRICPDDRLGILWAYHHDHPDVPRECDFGPYELLLSDYKDTVKVECLMGFAEVEEELEDCETTQHWCWNKRYKAKQRRIVFRERPGKRRRTGE